MNEYESIIPYPSTDRMEKKRVNTPLSGASIEEDRSIDFTQSKDSRLFVSRCVRVCVCMDRDRYGRGCLRNLKMR